MIPQATVRRGNLQRAVMIHSTAVGDFLIALRIMHLLGRAFDIEQIQLLGKRQMIGLGGALGIIHSGQDIELHRWSSLFTPQCQLSDHCQEYLRQFDLVVNMLAGPGAIVSRNIENLVSSGSKRAVHIEPRPPGDYPGHAFEYFWEQLTCQWPQLGGSGNQYDSDSCFQVSGQGVKKAGTVIGDLLGRQGPGILLAVHPGSGSAEKCWPWEKFCKLIQIISQRYTVLLILGEVELERFPEPHLALLRRSASAVVDCLSLEKLAGVLACCSGYVGNDSGVSHLAGSLGTASLVIFGPTDARIWKPLGPKVRTIQADNLQTLSVDRVLQALEELLARH